jgi:hypothetical protein
MLTISFPVPSLGVSPLQSLEAAKQWMKLRIAARRERLERKQNAARLLQLYEQDPSLYADLRVSLGPLPPSRSAVPLLPHAVVAGFFQADSVNTRL